MNGILNIYKEKGYTSHDVVAIVRKLLSQKKVGHTGTLDPEAEGVLPICLGKATKTVEFITDQKKQYRAVARLGITTTTQDHTGDILEKKDVVFNTQAIEACVNSFMGDYEQIPPMYSAIKVNGKKLYEFARKGQTIERKPRNVQIYDIQITEWLPPNQFEFVVTCSKGTYVRTLCSDIGEKLGFGGHMTSLVRTKVGIFDIEHSISIEQLKELIMANKMNKILLSIDDLFIEYPKVYVKQVGNKALLNGNRISLNNILKTTHELCEDLIVRTYDSGGTFVGLHTVYFENDKLLLKPLKIFI